MPDFETMSDIAVDANTRFMARNQAGSVAGCVAMSAVGGIVSQSLSGTFSPISHDHVEFLTQAEIEALPGFGGGSQSIEEYILIVDQKAQGTPGGSFTSGARRTRDVNTIIRDDTGLVAVNANQITLPSGSYRANISCVFRKVGRVKTWLRDVTNFVDLIVGDSSFSSVSYFGDGKGLVVGVFILASEATVEIQQQCSSDYATYGFGQESGFDVEIYTIAEFWRMAA